jgi:two-component system phosphate regulon sensor histidine kinase PhoR
VDKGRSRDQGGTGLGLAIVKHIIQYHNGRIEVESQKGQGTCFIITIPV